MPERSPYTTARIFRHGWSALGFLTALLIAVGFGSATFIRTGR